MQVGVDIVKIKRVKRLWKKHGEVFLDRFLSAKEKEFFLEKQSLSFLASRWAAKEALYKCFQGEKSWAWVRACSFLNDKNGAPVFTCEDEDLDFNLAVSISHEKKFALCFICATFK